MLRIHHAFPEPPDLEALYSADEPAQRLVIEALLEPEVMGCFNAYSERNARADRSASWAR